MSSIGARGTPVPVRVRTRWDDCDRYGHVNNAAFLALIRAAHDRAGLPSGNLREFEIGYRNPVRPEADVDVDVDVLEQVAGRLRVAYVLRVDSQVAAEAIALWGLAGGHGAAELPTLTHDAGGRPFRFVQAVRTYHLGPDGAVRPQVLLHWLEHAVFRAAATAGWPRERMEGAGFLTLVIGHQLVLGEPDAEGDELAVTSRLTELRRVSGTWHHEIRAADGRLVAADRARGAFLDLGGRIRPAPAGLLHDLLRGEPEP